MKSAAGPRTGTFPPLADCSARALIVLCGLMLSPREIGALIDVGDRDHRVGLGEMMRLLVERVRRDAGAATRLARVLEVRLGRLAAQFDDWPLGDVAEFWSRERDHIGKTVAAALLWTLCRKPGPLRRIVESRIAEDIELLALQALSQLPRARPADVVRGGKEMNGLMVSTCRAYSDLRAVIPFSALRAAGTQRKRIVMSSSAVAAHDAPVDKAKQPRPHPKSVSPK